MIGPGSSTLLSDVSTLCSVDSSPSFKKIYAPSLEHIQLSRRAKCARLITLTLSNNVLVTAPALSGKTNLALELCEVLKTKGVPYAFVSFEDLVPVTTNQRSKGLQLAPPLFEQVAAHFKKTSVTSVTAESDVDGVDSLTRARIVAGDLISVLKSPIVLVTDDTQNIYGTQTFWDNLPNEANHSCAHLISFATQVSFLTTSLQCPIPDTFKTHLDRTFLLVSLQESRELNQTLSDNPLFTPDILSSISIITTSEIAYFATYVNLVNKLSHFNGIKTHENVMVEMKKAENGIYASTLIKDMKIKPLDDLLRTIKNKETLNHLKLILEHALYNQSPIKITHLNEFFVRMLQSFGIVDSFGTIRPLIIKDHYKQAYYNFFGLSKLDMATIIDATLSKFSKKSTQPLLTPLSSPIVFNQKQIRTPLNLFEKVCGGQFVRNVEKVLGGYFMLNHDSGVFTGERGIVSLFLNHKKLATFQFLVNGKEMSGCLPTSNPTDQQFIDALETNAFEFDNMIHHQKAYVNFINSTSESLEPPFPHSIVYNVEFGEVFDYIVLSCEGTENKKILFCEEDEDTRLGKGKYFLASRFV